MAIATKASCTLGGKELIITGESIQLPLRAGTSLTMQLFTMAPADAKGLIGGPHTLIIHPLEGAEVKIEHLWVLNIQPGDVPYLARVLVADRRWFWDRGHIVGRYNMRRNVGVKRVLANADELQGVGDRAPDIAYWRYSLQPGGDKHSAQSMLADVMGKVSQIEKDYWGQTFQAILDDRIGSKIKTLPIEEFQIDDPGHEAVARAVGYLPEAAVTIDYDGKVIIFSRACG